MDVEKGILSNHLLAYSLIDQFITVIICEIQSIANRIGNNIWLPNEFIVTSQVAEIQIAGPKWRLLLSIDSFLLTIASSKQITKSMVLFRQFHKSSIIIIVQKNSANLTLFLKNSGCVQLFSRFEYKKRFFFKQESFRYVLVLNSKTIYMNFDELKSSINLNFLCKWFSIMHQFCNLILI